MAELFSPEWMQAFGEQWNAEPELADALTKIRFSSVIGYGFDDASYPIGVLSIVDGRVSWAGAYAHQKLIGIYGLISRTGKAGLRMD